MNKLHVLILGSLMFLAGSAFAVETIEGSWTFSGYRCASGATPKISVSENSSWVLSLSEGNFTSTHKMSDESKDCVITQTGQYAVNGKSFFWSFEKTTFEGDCGDVQAGKPSLAVGPYALTPEALSFEVPVKKIAENACGENGKLKQVFHRTAAK